MKKVRLILAGGALLLAGAGVYANTSATLLFYRSTTPGASCVTQYFGTVCPANTGPQCSIIDDNDVVQWISQKDDASETAPCTIRRKANP